VYLREGGGLEGWVIEVSGGKSSQVFRSVRYRDILGLLLFSVSGAIVVLLSIYCGHRRLISAVCINMYVRYCYFRSRLAYQGEMNALLGFLYIVCADCKRAYEGLESAFRNLPLDGRRGEGVLGVLG